MKPDRIVRRMMDGDMFQVLLVVFTSPPKSGKGQWDTEVSKYYVPLPLLKWSKQNFLLYPCILFWSKMFWTLLGYTLAKPCTNPNNLTWFTRPFLLVGEWGLGMRLTQCGFGRFHNSLLEVDLAAQKCYLSCSLSSSLNPTPFARV